MTASCPVPLATALVSPSRAISTSPHHLVTAIATSPHCLPKQKHMHLHLAVQRREPGMPRTLPTDCPCTIGLICAVYGGFQLFCNCFSKRAVKHLEILSNFSKSCDLFKQDFQLGKDNIPRKMYTSTVSLFIWAPA